MKHTTDEIIQDLLKRHSVLTSCEKSIVEAIMKMTQCYNEGNKILICGNGGSASDSMHIVGELMKSFGQKRSLRLEEKEVLNSFNAEGMSFLADNLCMSIPAISLTTESSLITSISNDIDPNLVFAQQVYGYGKKGDILLAISTSGKSKNIIYSIKVAKAIGLSVIVLTGQYIDDVQQYSDVILKVPADKTFLIQEYHLPLYHAICLAVENELFGYG